MFSALLQDFVNTIEEIRNTIQQLSKELKALAKSIADSRKNWWKILLGVILAVVVLVILIAVNVFFPGAGTVLLGWLSTGLRFLTSFFSFSAEVATNTAVGAVDVGAFFSESSSTTSLTESIDIAPVAETVIAPVTEDLVSGVSPYVEGLLRYVVNIQTYVPSSFVNVLPETEISFIELPEIAIPIDSFSTTARIFTDEVVVEALPASQASSIFSLEGSVISSEGYASDIGDLLDYIATTDLNAVPAIEQQTTITNLVGLPEVVLQDQADLIVDALPENMLREFLVQLAQTPNRMYLFLETVPLTRLQYVVELIPESILQQLPGINAFLSSQLSALGSSAGLA